MGPVSTDRPHPEPLDRERCLKLLETSDAGRVALSDQALPTIVPVRYRYDPRYVSIDLAFEALAVAAKRGHVVCFETDAEDESGERWSVTIVGRLEPVGDRALLATDLVGGHRLIA